MALLSNINDKFAVDSTGAIQFNGQVGTSGYILKSNANAAPTWVDPSTVIGGPYLPLSGGTLTGATATAAGISFTVGGTLSANGGINGLTLANGGINGSNYNIAGVNQLTIADPGEGIVFTGTTTLTLAVIDDTVDDKLKLTNATQLDLNSTARITNLLDPSSAQDAATKAYVDSVTPGVGPFLPLTGGTLTGALTGTSANFSGIVYSSGGFRTGSTNSSYNLLTRDNNNGSYPLYCQNSLGVSGDAAIARFAYGSYGANTGTAVLDVRSGTSYFNDCNLGIGITSPATTLQVSGSNLTNNVAVYIGGGFVNNDLYHREGGLLVISGTNANQTSAGIAFQTRNTNNTNYWKSSILMNRGGELEFYTGGAGTSQGTQRMRIESDGDVFLTEGNLTMSGATPFIVLSNTAETESGITFVDAQDAAQSAKITYSSGNNNLRFYNNASSERMLITSGGDIQISTNSASLQLRSSGSSSYTSIRRDSANQLIVANTAGNQVFGIGDGGELAISSGATYSTQYTYSNAWNAGYQTIILGSQLSPNSVYLITIQTNSFGTPPYYATTVFYVATSQGTNGNGGGNDNIAPTATHVSSNVYWKYRLSTIASGRNGVEAWLVNGPNNSPINPTIYVKATKIMTI